MRSFSLISAAVFFLTTTATASSLEERALATVYSNCKLNNTVALTFDDGPYIYEQDLIPTLAKYNAKATFFLNGNNWACIYGNTQMAALKALHDAGHVLGNHVWSHPHMTQLTWDKIHDEMWKVEQALIRIVGVNPALFRPPYGEYNDLVLSAAAARNQSAILWSFDSGDSVGATAAQTNKAYDDLAAKKPSSVLALNHSPYLSTVNITIPHALDVFSKAGYRFVTVSECLGIEPYQWTQAPQTKDSTWKC